MSKPLFSATEWSEIVAHFGLSPRQAEVAGQILKGRTDAMIAKALGIRKPTVRSYVGQLLTRLEVSNRLELAIRIFTVFRSLNDGTPRVDRHE
jgi:DNA-binding NarL/FixJ family response regulator